MTRAMIRGILHAFVVSFNGTETTEANGGVVTTLDATLEPGDTLDDDYGAFSRVGRDGAARRATASTTTRSYVAKESRTNGVFAVKYVAERVQGDGEAIGSTANVRHAGRGVGVDAGVWRYVSTVSNQRDLVRAHEAGYILTRHETRVVHTFNHATGTHSSVVQNGDLSPATPRARFAYF